MSHEALLVWYKRLEVRTKLNLKLLKVKHSDMKREDRHDLWQKMHGDGMQQKVEESYGYTV